jgi:hypothetical protein
MPLIGPFSVNSRRYCTQLCKVDSANINVGDAVYLHSFPQLFLQQGYFIVGIFAQYLSANIFATWLLNIWPVCGIFAHLFFQ